MRRSRRVIFTAVLLAWIAALPPAAATASPLAPSFTPIEIRTESISARRELAYSARLPLSTGDGDGSDHPRRSTWILLENDVPLGPAHALHADIESKGRGRYSHWHNSIIFSTSDNSDPRTSPAPGPCWRSNWMCGESDSTASNGVSS